MTHMEEKKVVEFSDAKKNKTFTIWTREMELIFSPELLNSGKNDRK